MLALLTLTSVQGADCPAWHPGIACWNAYDACKRLERHAQFVRYMTGPTGRLHVVVERTNAKVLLPIRPADLWPVWRMDADNDGDLDLWDYAALQREPN
jgi:hypothetical protein